MSKIPFVSNSPIILETNQKGEHINIAWTDMEEYNDNIYYSIKMKAKDEPDDTAILIANRLHRTTTTIKFSDYYDKSYRGKSFVVKINAYNGALYGKWSNWSGTYIWSDMSNAPLSFYPNSGIYKDFIPLSWSEPIIQNEENYIKAYNIVVSKNSWGNWTEIKPLKDSFTGTTFNYDISKDPEGTKYYFGIQSINIYNACSEWKYSNVSTTNIYKNNSPQSPTNIEPKSGYYQSNIPLKWNAGYDIETSTNKLSYEIQITNDEIIWNTIEIIKNGVTNYDYNIPFTNPGGTKFKFRIRTIDEHNSTSDWSYMDEYLIKNYVPTSPENIWVIGTYHEASISIHWSQGNGINNNTEDLNYRLEVSKNDGYWKEVITTKKNITSYGYNISEDLRGTKYTFRVKTIDPFGISSEYKTMTYSVYRNEVPYTPQFINTESLYNNILITWNSGDTNGKKANELYYVIEVSKNNKDWQLIKTTLKNELTFNYNIESDIKGTSYMFRIKSVDPFNISSNWIETKYSIYNS